MKTVLTRLKHPGTPTSRSFFCLHCYLKYFKFKSPCQILVFSYVNSMSVYLHTNYGVVWLNLKKVIFSLKVDLKLEINKLIKWLKRNRISKREATILSFVKMFLFIYTNRSRKAKIGNSYRFLETNSSRVTFSARCCT